MARNRKRAKERRARRPQPVTTPAEFDQTPGALAHAAPDVELAEAQLALGRPDLASAGGEPEPEDESLNEQELEFEAQAAAPRRGGFDGERGGGGPPAVPGASVPEPRPRPASRLIGFLQGSWAELQRVQWPDRRQVMQATGVVIGFVIVAGVFLGVADTLAQHLVNYILYGHW